MSSGRRSNILFACIEPSNLCTDICSKLPGRQPAGVKMHRHRCQGFYGSVYPYEARIEAYKECTIPSGCRIILGHDPGQMLEPFEAGCALISSQLETDPGNRVARKEIMQEAQNKIVQRRVVTGSLSGTGSDRTCGHVLFQACSRCK